MPQSASKSPSVSVRSFAELLVLPAFQHVRILNEQKYPKQAPNVFRLPFYAPAVTAIRAYYKAGNSSAKIRAAVAEASTLKPPSKRQHNVRVLTTFANGQQAKRVLSPRTADAFHANAGHDVSVRLKFDLVADESSNERMIFYNFREQPLEDELARYSLEIAAWALQSNGVNLTNGAIEYVDLTANKTYSSKPIRATTLKAIKANATVISAIWTAL